MKSKSRRWIFLIIFFIIIQYRGYYIRNLKVDNEFIITIVEKVCLLEKKKNNNIQHTLIDVDNLHRDLNKGHMANSSNLEYDIKVQVGRMSSDLGNYYNSLDNGDKKLPKEHMDKYMENLQILEELLEPLKEKKDDLNILWEKGIFE